MPSSTSLRPDAPRRFSSHLRRYNLPPNNSTQHDYGTLPARNSSVSFRSNSELEGLLEAQHVNEEHADSDGLYPPHCCWTDDQPDPPARADPFGNRNCPVYDNIHRIRRELLSSIDDPYSLEQLKAPRMNVSVIRPLVDQFYHSQDLSIVYCLLVNRAQFIREQSYATHHQTVNLTRALVCEILAEKVLRRYNEHNPGPKGLLKLANILVAGFEAFQNAPQSVIQDNSHVIHYLQKRGNKYERKLTALELAIISESKSFLASSACQKVVDAIYRGKLVYTPNSFIDIIPDHWKKRPISLYDPRRGPWLNQYRMIVPRTRNAIEIGQFIILLVLYLVVMQGRESRMTMKYTFLEGIFNIYALGWILDQLGSILEHGWQVYTQNLWSFLDVGFSGIFCFYFVVRMHSLTFDDPDEALPWARLSLDALSCAAPILVPRLAFNIMSENLVFLCLRSMMADFLTLVLLAIWCFLGFLLSLKWLHNHVHEPLTIGKWMIWIWFGLDGTGIDKAPDFHWILGPVVMILFAFLGNTLFLTILVSMLSNTFSSIAQNAVIEVQFRRAVLTFEGVKSDAIFAFMPPFNVLALLFVLPLKFFVSRRWFHKIIVGSVKVINAPLLIVISLYERKTLWLARRYHRIRPKRIDWRNANGPRAINNGWWSRAFQFWHFSRFSVHGDIQAVFDDAPPPSAHGEDEGGPRDTDIGKSLRDEFNNQFNDALRLRKSINTSVNSSRRKSSAPTPIREEFGEDTSEDGDDDEGDQADHPKGYRKPTRGERMDSLIDFNDSNVGLQEANARLHKLEEGMQKIESLLLQITHPTASSSDTGSDVQEDINPIQENGEIL